MKQLKTCSSAHFAVLLTILLVGCGNKGPLVRPVPVPESAPALEQTDAEIEQKEPKK